MSKRKSPGYWTKEKCQESALKCKSKIEFIKKYRGAYKRSNEKGWYKEITSHMTRPTYHNLKWTKEKCKEEASKYKSRTEFSKKYTSAYVTASKNNWLDDICCHMTSPRKPQGYWNDFNNVLNEAHNHKTRTEFNRKSLGAYNSAMKHGWLNQIYALTNMGKSLNGHYIIYVYLFDDNYFYVGLTRRRDKRFYDHKTSKKSSVYKHTQKTGLNPKRKILWDINVYDSNVVISKEEYWIKKYIMDGWKPLNIRKAGSLGGNIIKWTKEKCRKESLKYKKIHKFRIGSGSAYVASYRNKWLDEFFPNKRIRKPANHWKDYNNCKEMARSCKNRWEFSKKCLAAYTTSSKNKWLDEFFPKKEKFPNN